MALLARHVLVLARQRILGRHVIELDQWLPAVDGVALFAVSSQLLPMDILMTAQASSVESLQCLVQIFDLDNLAIHSGYVLGIVTFLTSQPGVFSHQRVPGLLVVEFLLGSVPFVDPEVAAVMFGMTAHAVRVTLFSLAPVVTRPLIYQLPNLSMTWQTLEFSASRKDMAGSAIEGTVQRLMRLGQWSW